MLAQLARFTSVGVLATLIHVLVASAARYGFALEPQLANLAGFLAAVSFSYFGHASFTFRADGPHSQQAPLFGVLALTGLLISSLTTFLVVDIAGGSFALAMILVAIAVPAATFVGSKFWVFEARRDVIRDHNILALALALGTAVLFYLVLQDRQINHDTAWYLVATRKWLDGAVLYVDLVEVNPPLNFYLTIPVIWLSDALGLADQKAQYLFLSCLIFGSLASVWAVLRRAEQLEAGQRACLLIAAALGVSITAGAFVGQREQIMLLLVMPYVVGHLVLSVPDRGQGALLRAAFAGVGFCIKPHFVLFPAVLTLVRMIAERSLRPLFSPANCVMLAIGVAYVAGVKILHPAYLDTVVPTAMHVYGDYGFGTDKVMANIDLAFLGVSLLALLLAVRMAKTTGVKSAAGVLAGLVLAGTAIYFVQWTGYDYQAIPAYGFAALTVGWVIAQSGRARLPLILSIAATTLFSLTLIQKGFYKNGATHYFAAVIEAEVSDPRVMVFSTSLWPSFPMVFEADAEWTSRYPALWLIPGAVNGLSRTDCTVAPETCVQLKTILVDTRTAIVDDLIAQEPNVIIVETDPAYIDAPFDFHDFLGNDPRYAPFLETFGIVHRTSTDEFVIFAKR